ncbi:hypothetical protein T439DRAFT_329677 [Meredithblackwellia eburnea MCA 4105]
MVWSRVYCCCAVPLYNSGIYAIITQFLVVSLVTGCLSFAAPRIVAVAIPSWGPYLFGILNLVVAAAQVFGFLGVYREKPKLFKTYARVNAGLVSITLLVAVAFIGLSAARHSTAVTKCQSTFSSQSSSGVKSGSQICNIWTWVQVGIMGLLWIIIGLCEAYFVMYSNIYASEQRLDHARYETVVSTAAEEIRQSQFYDPASSSDPFAPPRPSLGGAHGRTESKASGLRNEVLADEEMYPQHQQYNSSGYPQQQQQYHDYQDQGYGHDGQYYTDQGAQGYQDPYYPDQAHNAYSQPTPHQPYYSDNYQSGYPSEKSNVGYPDQARTEHPLDGASRHKTPKLPSPVDTDVGNLRWDPAQHR